MTQATPNAIQPDDDPGRDWMLAFQRGDDAAFRRIVLHYGERVAAFFRRTGADRASAEDLMQEAFLRVARARDRWEPTAKFSTWLHQIVARIAMNEGTRNRWRRALAAPELREDRRNDPAESASLAELQQRVREAVASLPEPQRTALLLHRFEGCSYDEVGTALCLSLPAVKSLLFRAKESVKERLLPLLNDNVSDEVSHGT